VVSWLVSDCAGSFLGAWLMPHVVLNSALIEQPVEFVATASFLVFVGRLTFFLIVCPRKHLGLIDSMSLFAFVVQAVFTVEVGACLMHAVVVLFGAPATELVVHTLALSHFLSTLVFLNVAFAHSSKSQHFIEKGYNFLVKRNCHSIMDTCLLVQAYGTVFGAWIGAFPIPLDWDRPWQRWPVTILYGAWMGYGVSCIGLVFYALYQQYSVKEKHG